MESYFVAIKKQFFIVLTVTLLFIHTNICSSTLSSAKNTTYPKGWVLPIKGSQLPTAERLLPASPRPYRNGIHEGIDFYVSNGRALKKGHSVRAVDDGEIIRIDRHYDTSLLRNLLENKDKFTKDESLDIYRGMQVWIGHNDGIVSRYSHLDSTEPLNKGDYVCKGEKIGSAGNSGTPSSLSNPPGAIHLHFEIRIGDE